MKPEIVIVLTVSISRKVIPVMVIVIIANYILGKLQMMDSVGVLLGRSDFVCVFYAQFICICGISF